MSKCRTKQGERKADDDTKRGQEGARRNGRATLESRRRGRGDQRRVLSAKPVAEPVSANIP